MQLNARFIGCAQDIHDANTGDDAMVSRVEFEVSHGGKVHRGSLIVKQIAGGDYAADPLEVGWLEYPKDAPRLKYDSLRDQAERYYRGLVGEQGRVSRFGAGAQSIRMRNNYMAIEMPFVAEAVESSGGGW